ncbi:hypothetical protein [Methylobacterium sp. SD21]|uniref:hypothetical protein n=1 Tax=Methylobacterium litchii TaxID=3138810 RepID=UPI00313E2159
MAEPINLAAIMAGRLRDAGHLNYGKRGGGTIWQHTTIPRLQAIDRPTLSVEETDRVGATRMREWSVDGGKGGSIEDAIVALNVPPVLSLGEFVVLAKVPAEFDWLRAVQARIAGIAEEDAPTCVNDHPRYCAVTEALMRLRHVGLVRLEQRPVEKRGEFGPRTMPMICRTQGGAVHG